jgi:predicted MPP superfamily phosphohydrolase
MSVENRRAFLKRLKNIYAPVLLGMGAPYGYGSVIERHRIVVERHDVKLALGKRGPQRLRIVSLTDFHFDPLYEEDFLTDVVHRTNSLNPDLVVLTGDYITDTAIRMDDFAKVMSGLKPKSGIFGCLGNHDTWHTSSHVTASLKKRGVEMLMNQHSRVPCAGGEIVVAGLHSAWGGFPNWAGAMQGTRGDDRAVLLMHEPDTARTLCNDRRIVLQLSGHTHGGQVRMPGLGALRLPKWGKIYQSGFYDVNGLQLYVSRGVGTIGVHVRFLCPPEIACFDIVNTDTLV